MVMEYQIRIADKSTVLKANEFTVTLKGDYRKAYKVICNSLEEASAAVCGYNDGFEMFSSTFRGGQTSIKNTWIGFNGSAWKGKIGTNTNERIEFTRDNHQELYKTFYDYFSNLLYA